MRTVLENETSSPKVTIALLFVGLLTGRVISAPREETLLIKLRPVVSVNSPVLRVADVADVSGGTESLRQRIETLDLEDAPLAGGQTEITRRQIEFRLRVAGVDLQSVMIRGSAVLVSARVSGTALAAGVSTDADDTLSVASAIPLTVSEIEQAVLRAVRKCLSKQLPWPEDDVVIQLTQPLPRELCERMRSAEATCTAELRTSGTPLGQVTFRIVMKSPGQRPLDVPVQLGVRHFEDVVVTTKPVARGHLFMPTDLEIHREDVTQLVGFCSSSERLVGQQAKRVIPAAQIVRANDFEPASAATKPLLVKRRARLKAIARSGVLQVTIVGEAMQDGRAGEVIKVKNVDSNAMIYGRVVSANEVEVTE